MALGKYSLCTILCTFAINVLTTWASPVIPRTDLNLPYTGCGKNVPSGQAIGSVSNVSITSGGYQRSYLIYVAPTYNKFVPASVILSYHGGNRNATSQLELDLLTNSEFNTQSFVIYPQGIGVSKHPLMKLECDTDTHTIRIPGRAYQMLLQMTSNSP